MQKGGLSRKVGGVVELGLAVNFITLLPRRLLLLHGCDQRGDGESIGLWHDVVDFIHTHLGVQLHTILELESTRSCG